MRKRLLGFVAALALALGVTAGVPSLAYAYSYAGGTTTTGKTCSAYGGTVVAKRKLIAYDGTAVPVELLVTHQPAKMRLCYSLRSLNGRTWTFSAREKYVFNDGYCNRTTKYRTLGLGTAYKSARHGVSTHAFLTSVRVHAEHGRFAGSTTFSVPRDGLYAC